MSAIDEPVVLPKIRRKVLGDQLEGRLKALPGLPAMRVYRGEVSKTPPVMLTADGVQDAAGRVAAYVVLFDGTGPTDLETGLQRCGEQLRWTPTMTIAAGFSSDCVHAADRVFAWVDQWTPSLPGVNTGQLQMPPGFDPGQPRPDQKVTPVRYFVSLSWQIDLTT